MKAAKIITTAIGLVVGAGIILFTPSNAWYFILSFMFFAPILTNIAAYLFVRLFHTELEMHPLIPFIILVVAQIVLVCSGILVSMMQNNGQLLACADVCSPTSFANQFLISFFLSTFLFAGGLVGLIKTLIDRHKTEQQPKGYDSKYAADKKPPTPTDPDQLTD